MFEHPALLFWGADTNENEIAAGLADLLFHLLVLGWSERTERRRKPSHNPQSGELLTQALFEQWQNFRTSTI